MTCVDYLSDLSETANKFDSELKAATAKATKALPKKSNASDEKCFDQHKSDAKSSIRVKRTSAETTCDENVKALGGKSTEPLKRHEEPSKNQVVCDEGLNQGPRHVTICIDNKLASKTFESEIFGKDVPDFGIVGLHTCGDLGPNLVGF